MNQSTKIKLEKGMKTRAGNKNSKEKQDMKRDSIEWRAEKSVQMMVDWSFYIHLHL